MLNKQLFAILLPLLICGCVKENIVSGNIPLPEFPDAPSPQASIKVKAEVEPSDCTPAAWLLADRLDVWHNGSDGLMVADGAFALINAATGAFSGSLGEGLRKEAYTWTAVYPHSESTTSISHVSMTFGDGSFPMYGRSFPTMASPEVAIRMVPAASVLELRLLNPTSYETVVSKVEVTASEAIVGEFIADLVSREPVFTPGDDASRTASLSFEPVEIAPGGEASLRLVVKPFSQASGMPIAVAVWIGGVKREYSVNPGSFTCYAGKLRTLAVDLSGDESQGNDDPVVEVNFSACTDVIFGQSCLKATGTFSKGDVLSLKGLPDAPKLIPEYMHRGILGQIIFDAPDGNYTMYYVRNRNVLIVEYPDDVPTLWLGGSFGFPYCTDSWNQLPSDSSRRISMVRTGRSTYELTIFYKQSTMYAYASRTGNMRYLGPTRIPTTDETSLGQLLLFIDGKANLDWNWTGIAAPGNVTATYKLIIDTDALTASFFTMNQP